MKLSLNICQEFSSVDLKTLSKDQLIEKINQQIGATEEVIDLGAQYQGVLVAKIVSCEKHPDADKLSLCKIDDGGANKQVARDASGYVQVVCGAPNAREGLIVAWIPPGVVVPSTVNKDPLTLEAREIRGQVSGGMLASESELDISGEHTGLLEINASDEGEELTRPGTEFKKLYGLDDLVFDIENKMFTHRPDLFGQLGLARELAGIQGLKFNSPTWYTENVKFKDAENSLVVENQIPKLCARYMAVALDGIKVGPSPTWLKSNLHRLGIRPINNVVDITNYMMILTGQPMHAFDADKISGKIIIRNPKKGEKMTLLDGKEITLDTGSILIADEQKPIALGGVMGAKNSEVSKSTTRIIVECANFDMFNIRRSSMHYGIFSDSVTRFTKGQSPRQCAAVLSQSLGLFEQLTGGKQASDICDEYVVPAKPANIDVKLVNESLGTDLSDTDVATILNNVEINVAAGGRGQQVQPPFWRTDLEIYQDIIEEVGRLYGFNKLPKSLPSRTTTPPITNKEVELKKNLRQALASFGANEVLTYNFVHGNLLTKAGQTPENSYKLRNALSPDLEYYRQTITPSLLDKVHPNIKSGHDEFALFEIGKSHNKVHSKKDEVPQELDMLAMVYANKKPAKTDGSAYFQARNYLDQLMASFGLTLEYKTVGDDMIFPVTAPFDFKRSALVTTKETKTFIGIVGEYKQEVANGFKLPDVSAGFEIGTAHILEALGKKTDSGYKPLGRYPSTTQDINTNVAGGIS